MTVAGLLLVSSLVSSAGADAWHQTLCLSNGGHWHARVRVSVQNGLDRQVDGEPVALRVGKGDGEIGIVGQMAESIRVCTSDGREFLFNITGPDGERITQGEIPDGSRLTFPVECAPQDAATCYVYFDNPSAWSVPDYLEASVGVRNGRLEQGAHGTPAGWRHDTEDAAHRAEWSEENPHAGRRCLKTVVAEGAEATWIATRQGGIHIIGGTRYVMRAWVRAENVKGFAAWYIHVGNSKKSMMLAPTLNGGNGTYDWKLVTTSFTAPPDADRASLGTVLRGTGVAWFDDVTLEPEEAAAGRLAAHAERPERLDLREFEPNANWFDENPKDDLHWDYRWPVRVANFSDTPLAHAFVCVDVAPIDGRLRGRLNRNSLRVLDGAAPISHYELGNAIVFAVSVPAKSVRTFYVYCSEDSRIPSATGNGYEVLLESDRNRVKNPSFESGDTKLDGWRDNTAGRHPEGVVVAIDTPGKFGRHCGSVKITDDDPKGWFGWQQNVPVEPEKTYLLAAWMRCRDVQDGSVQLHAHYRNAQGALCQKRQYTSAGPALSGTQDWTLLQGQFQMPEDIASFQLHLTTSAGGTVWHDGVVLVEVTPGRIGMPETRTYNAPEGLAVWPVNPVIKLFREDLPPRSTVPARISAARNEYEPLQLAVRSSQDVGDVQVEVDAPAHANGQRLTDIEVSVVGYVPIDHATSYYRSDTPVWERKVPTRAGSCDGWAGWWPDPLLPRHQFSLQANQTQPVWITVRVPKEAASGDYTGSVRLVNGDGGKTFAKIPFTVHVWDFTLPDENHVAAVYDLRLGNRWRDETKTIEESRTQFWQFMAKRRVSPDRVSPEPVFSFRDGKAEADFTEFDEAARVYFEELKMPFSYMPRMFYCFGWGHPPHKVSGEEPYEGEFPYDDVDRSKLRPEFRRAYQACLKLFWDHLKDRGWADRFVLYISDEPYYHLPHIQTQMKALCDMIHEVDAKIPIYCSTWNHRPEWDGFLDVWGIGHDGRVSTDKMAELRAAGDRLWFTTDGQMCTDTPYCAVERLLPHYCFHYSVEAYEFWGISWLTYDPYQFGWHSYIHQSGTPGEEHWVRYPNGDGYLAYPGAPIGHDGPVSSIRLEQAREGVEDYEYLYLLRELTAEAKSSGRDVRSSERVLEQAAGLVTIPNAGGRYSSRILTNPNAVPETRQSVAQAIEKLLRKAR